MCVYLHMCEQCVYVSATCHMAWTQATLIIPSPCSREIFSCRSDSQYWDQAAPRHRSIWELPPPLPLSLCMAWWPSLLLRWGRASYHYQRTVSQLALPEDFAGLVPPAVPRPGLLLAEGESEETLPGPHTPFSCHVGQVGCDLTRLSLLWLSCSSG